MSIILRPLAVLNPQKTGLPLSVSVKSGDEWSCDTYDSSCSEDDRFIQDTNSEDILHDGLISPDRVISPELSLRASSSGVRQDHQPPVYIPEDVPVPEYFELRESKSFQGLGVWAKVLIPEGELFGPFTGVLKTKLNDASCAWKIVDGTNNIKAWIDASEPGTGNWMKYICRTKTKESQNLMAVQVQDQVYYRTIRDVHPAEEMLLYSTESPYPDPKELDNLTFGKINQDDNMYTCSECDEVFSSQVALKRHQAYTCPKLVRLMTNDHYRSEDDSKSATDPDTHLHDESADGEFKCEECPRSFQWKSNLVRHQISHDSGRRYQCENCDKVFTDPSNLQRHIRSQHVGARCHACAECGKTFATSSGLKQHQHIHSSVKPFQCEVCLKAYTQFSNLCRHKRMHADCRQQIKCKDCGQAFSTVTSLSKHKRFCEGALRNGMHMGFSTDKMNPMNLPAAGNPANTLNPALLMGMYRPPFPFYPPVGATYPVFPSGPIPFASMHSPMSPSNPSKLGQAMSPDAKAMIPRLSPRPLSAGSDSKHEERHRRNSMGSEPSDSPFSSSSEAEHDFSGVSDAESESSGLKKPKPIFPSERTRNLLSSSHLTSEPVPLPVYSPSPIRRSPIDSKSHKDQDIPFDLSKSNKSSATPSPDIVTPNKEKSVSGGEQPLDLTQKVPKEVTPPENARKTHIFGELRSPQVTPESKLHYAYPQFPNHLLFDHSLRMDKEKLSQSMQEASRFLPFAARFPMTNASFAASMNPFGMMKHEAMEKNLSPMLKMDKFPDQFSAYSSPGNKLKERYSCKFCGKVFPRSANLTRHLRTHTGEQPYKCKYCERSFSISSNLQRHVRNIHNKEKPFKCPLCDRCFGQQTNLDRHLKKHDSEDPSIMDSPLNEPDLDEKDESYFSEIRNFIGKATESGLSRGIMNGLEDRHPLMDHEVERDDKYDVAVEAESDIDDDELLEDEEESALEQPPVKKICLTPPRFYTNNNDEEKTFVATHFQNGYRELEKEEEEVDVISDSEVKSATSTIV